MSKPRTMSGRKMVSLPQELWEAIEDFRFENRLRSEAEAVRRLVELGLQASGEYGKARVKEAFILDNLDRFFPDLRKPQRNASLGRYSVDVFGYDKNWAPVLIEVTGQPKTGAERLVAAGQVLRDPRLVLVSLVPVTDVNEFPPGIEVLVFEESEMRRLR